MNRSKIQNIKLNTECICNPDNGQKSLKKQVLLIEEDTNPKIF